MTSNHDTREPLIGEWGGHPNYQCPFCAYSTLDKGDMDAHIHPLTGRHPAGAPVDSPIATSVNLEFYERLQARHDLLLTIVTETQKGRDRLVKDGLAVVGEDGDLWVSYGDEDVSATGIAAIKGPDEGKE